MYEICELFLIFQKCEIYEMSRRMAVSDELQVVSSPHWPLAIGQ
jgi:hypothetical protein